MATASSTRPGQDPVCPRCGGVGYYRRDVPLGHPDFGRAIACDCQAAMRQAARLEGLRRASNLGHLSRFTFASFVPEGYGLPPAQRENLRRAFETARAYAAKPEGWLLLMGRYGCGKTHLAAAIANERIASGQPVLFMVVPDLLDHLRAAYRPEADMPYDEQFSAVREAPLLVLDDLGTQSTTPWAQEKLFQLLNHRYNAQLPTVITTNRELEDIEPRLRSRLADGDLVRLVRILAPDFRQAGAEPSELSTLHLHRDKTFATFDRQGYNLTAEQRENLRQAADAAQAFAGDPDGWLVLLGDHGSGKTHLAAAIANYRLGLGEQALFVVVPDLLDHLRAAFNPNSTVSLDRRFEEVRNAPLLVLDDLGTQSTTPWAQEKLYQLLNHRYNARLPTVITTNLTLEEIDARLRARILDPRRVTIFAIIAPSYLDRLSTRKSPERPRGRGQRSG
ncbi:MAG: ATP-binding protein [Anaerolineae bacterium]